MKNFLTIVNVILVISSEVNSRKYDIEDEAMKLYGEDLKSVLKRFRRTPDYLKILKDKTLELRAHYEDVVLQTMFHYNFKLTEKIDEMLHIGKDDQEAGKSAGDALRYMRSSFNFPLDTYYDMKHKHKHNLVPRQGMDEARNPVESLDKYHLLTSTLTLQERNMFRDLGFEFAGKIIHAVIKAMGSEDFSQKSTRLPMGGAGNEERRPATTTQHYHDVISTFDAQSTQGPEALSTDESFKYKFRAPKSARLKHGK